MNIKYKEGDISPINNCKKVEIGIKIPKNIKNIVNPNRMVTTNKDKDILIVENQFLKRNLVDFLILIKIFSFLMIIKKRLNLAMKAKIKLNNKVIII